MLPLATILMPPVNSCSGLIALQSKASVLYKSFLVRQWMVISSTPGTLIAFTICGASLLSKKPKRIFTESAYFGSKVWRTVSTISCKSSGSFKSIAPEWWTKREGQPKLRSIDLAPRLQAITADWAKVFGLSPNSCTLKGVPSSVLQSFWYSGISRSRVFSDTTKSVTLINSEKHKS